MAGLYRSRVLRRSETEGCLPWNRTSVGRNRRGLRARGDTLIFAKESIAEIWDQFLEIAEKHWLETEAYRHQQKLNPDKQRYVQYEQMGIYHLFTARDEGALVGYGGFYIMPSMHTQQLIAMEDTYYLAPEYRKGWNAVRFLKFMEAYGVGKGVVESSLSTKTSNPKAERMLQYLGYGFVEKRWSKHH